MTKALEEGAKAPAFSLPTDGDGRAALKDFAGGVLVLYFYPKDSTPGCTTEAVDFSSLISKFEKEGATVVGVSADPVEKHAKFREKNDLKVILASDESLKTLEKYGVWKEKSLYGRKFMGIERTTFLIDGKGVIRRIWRKVKVTGHADEVLAAVKAL